MARTRYKFFENEYPYFVTCTIVGWLPIFTRPETINVIYDAWNWAIERQRLEILGFVIMENHLHAVIASDNPAKHWAAFKSFSAREIIDYLVDRQEERLLKQLRWEKAAHKIDREYQLWQEGSKPKQIRTETTLRQKLEYMHNNPLKRTYVADPIHWLHSSARIYAGEQGQIPIVIDW